MENQNELIQQSQELIIKLSNALQETQEKLKTSNEIIEKQKSELKTWDKITDSDNWYDMSSVAKKIHEKSDKYKTYGRNMIFALLRDSNILRINNEPYQIYCDKEYFKQIIVDKNMGDKTIGISKTLISLKGIEFIMSIIDNMETKYE